MSRFWLVIIVISVVILLGIYYILKGFFPPVEKNLGETFVGGFVVFEKKIPLPEKAKRVKEQIKTIRPRKRVKLKKKTPPREKQRPVGETLTEFLNRLCFREVTTKDDDWSPFHRLNSGN